ncbi:aldo/keto reductase [Tautonia sp. JC769]|uniref:aldo/keto reductase n=1 Tax=Tautonia sp. JC769 TaxID=3232135 RepID=UPI003459AA6D
MAHDPIQSTDRRTFLQAGALASATIMGSASGSRSQEAEAPGEAVLPRRTLGKTGVEVTLLDQGAIRGPSYDRLLRFAFASGIRMFDTARVYGTEGNLRRWFEQAPEVRKEIFLVTKDTPRSPKDLVDQLDRRLEALGTDYIDLFFIHGLGDDHSLDDAMNMVSSQEFKETAETIRKSGKARFVGFSTHHKDRPQILQAAAKAGHVDAIMLQYRPWLDRDAPLNRALDACWEKGIGLISMKQIAGQLYGDAPQGNILDDVVARVPVLKERNLTPFQGLLHAIWSDERISSICCSMRNTEQIRENVDAAHRFEPLEAADINRLRDATLAHGPTLCANCDGRCSLAGGTRAALGDLTRFLTYSRHLGDRSEARRQYARLSSDARDWSDADLAAARAACPEHLDFARLLPEIERHLA